MTIFPAVLCSAVFLACVSSAQEWRFPCPSNEIARYTAHRITNSIRIDGKLDEAAWQRAPKSPRFVDILTGAPTLYDTRAAVLWDNEHLYIGFQIEEPNVRAKYTNRNDPIYYDNDVEVFIAGRDAYYEFEVNAFNTVYEVFFIWTPTKTGALLQRLSLRAQTLNHSTAWNSKHIRVVDDWVTSTGRFRAGRMPSQSMEALMMTAKRIVVGRSNWRFHGAE